MSGPALTLKLIGRQEGAETAVSEMLPKTYITRYGDEDVKSSEGFMLLTVSGTLAHWVLYAPLLP